MAATGLRMQQKLHDEGSRGGMNFSGVSYQTRLGRLLRVPLSSIPASTRLPILQGKLRGKKWIVGSSNHGCWLGSYEYEKRRVFEKTVAEGRIVFDIGAHVGFYTLLASVLVGPGGSVYAFEPLPSNLLYLKEHLRLNAITNTTVIEAAVSEQTGETNFDEGPGSSMAHISSTGKLRVKTVSLDDLISSGQIPVPHYTKVDVEGAEALVLSGATHMLANAHPTLFLATHGRDLHKHCCRFLSSLGYELQPVGGQSLEHTDEILAYVHG